MVSCTLPGCTSCEGPGSEGPTTRGGMLAARPPGNVNKVHVRVKESPAEGRRFHETRLIYGHLWGFSWKAR